MFLLDIIPGHFLWHNQVSISEESQLPLRCVTWPFPTGVSCYLQINDKSLFPCVYVSSPWGNS